jgi:hypothetical protein
VLADCADPARDDEFNAWYDRYASDCLRPGLLRSVARFEDREGSPEYLALYETAMPDPLGAWLNTFKHPARRHAHDASELLVTALRASYVLVAAVPDPDGSPLSGPLTIVSSDGGGVIGEGAWHEHLSAGLVASGGRSAASFELLEGSPAPPRFVEIYEGCSRPWTPAAPFRALRRRDVRRYEQRWLRAID